MVLGSVLALWALGLTWILNLVVLVWVVWGLVFCWGFVVQICGFLDAFLDLSAVGYLLGFGFGLASVLMISGCDLGLCFGGLDVRFVCIWITWILWFGGGLV